MDKIEKLLRKVKLRDSQRLEQIIKQLVIGKLDGLDVKKIKNSDFFRARAGRFRIIFHHDKNRNKNIIDSVRLRDKDTYK